MHMPFIQSPPRLGNQYADDRALRSLLRRKLPDEVHRDIEPSLQEMGELAGGELYQLQLEDRTNEPSLKQWDAWGQRVDEISLSSLWRKARSLASQKGVVATAYEARHGRFSRIHQLTLAYLFHPSTDVYSCPLAMSDGAARTLLESGNKDLIARAVPHLTSRDPMQFWTSGQWMTEISGGSDVGCLETVARKDEAGGWRLHGRKWFTSAITSEMSLALARPEGNPPGGKGLALFYVETRDDRGRLQNIRVNRLKEKLGTRKVPTAELSLEGVPAELVREPDSGVRDIVPMLLLTRTWNSVSAVSFMRRGIALARSYAACREVFNEPLASKPLHVDTLAALQAETEAALHITYLLVELIGCQESREINEQQAALLRIVSSLAKILTGKQAVGIASEVLEIFGGAGYVEDTGLPVLLRDSQVLPIWEGTSNVLSLDVLRAVREGGLAALGAHIDASLFSCRHGDLVNLASRAQHAVSRASQWYEGAVRAGGPMLEAGARRFAMLLGRALALALLVEHAQWSLDQEEDPRPLAAARRYASLERFDLEDPDWQDSHILANDYNPREQEASGGTSTPKCDAS